MIRWHNDPAPDAPRWRAEVNGQTIAYAARTGRPGVDDYPWDWYFLHGVVTVYDWTAYRGRTSGTVDTLRHAKDEVRTAWIGRSVKR